MQTIWDFINKTAACVKLQKFCIYIQIKYYWIKNQMKQEPTYWITTEKVMHQTSKKGQCCQQPNYKDLAIKTALTIELQFKIWLVKVKNCVKDQLLRFQFDLTVNEVGVFILWKVCSAEKWVAPDHMLLGCEILTCSTVQFGILHFYLLKVVYRWYQTEQLQQSISLIPIAF